MSHGGFLLPIDRPSVLGSAQRFEEWGRRFSLPVGAIYFIEAAKDSMPITPIRPRWPIMSRPVIVRPVGQAAGAGRSRKIAKLSIVEVPKNR